MSQIRLNFNDFRTGNWIESCVTNFMAPFSTLVYIGSLASKATCRKENDMCLYFKLICKKHSSLRNGIALLNICLSVKSSFCVKKILIKKF